MLIAVTDTETTGMDELDQVLELVVGFYHPDENQNPVTSFDHMLQWLIRPTVPVHPAARGTHHITDKELADKPTLAEYLNKYPDPFYDLDDEYETVFCAHNAEFDVRLLMQSLVAAGHLAWRPDSILPVRTIDTWVCARHLWPDAPGYGNQTLRYWLELDRLYPEMTEGLGACGLPPHRALPDVIVTTHLLRRMLELRSPEELITLTGTPVLQVTCFMPKHRGKTWAEVARQDPGYCRWMLDQGPVVDLGGGKKSGFDADTIHTLKYHLGLL